MMSKPNFSGAYSKANEILVTSPSLTSFPFPPKKLVKEQASIVCRSFKKAKEYGVDMTAFGSESAVIVQFGKNSIIFYDETKPETHIFAVIPSASHPSSPSPPAKE